MSCIGANIRKIRTVKKFSQAAFAELFGLARPSVGAWEEGRAEPKTDTLIQIAQHFGVSVDLLLTKELTVNDLYHFDLYQHQRHSPDASPVSLVPDEQPHLTPFVRADQLLEYGMRGQDPAWLATLPLLTLPHNLGPATRAFEIGDSALTHAPTGGLRPGDVVIAARLHPATATAALRPGYLYVLGLRTGPLIRRLHLSPEAATELLCHADNPDYPPRTVALPEVVELWEIHAVLTAPPASPTPLAERVARLEARVVQLPPPAAA